MLTAAPSRRLAPRLETLNAQARTVDAVLTSDAPVPEMDYARGMTIPRVLLPSGAKWPAIDQVPLLDTHTKSSVRSLCGSVRRIRREDRLIIGTLHLADQKLFDLIADGHLTDVSAGFSVLLDVYIPRGKEQNVGGRIYVGPTTVVVSWRLREVSLACIGLDETCRVRNA